MSTAKGKGKPGSRLLGILLPVAVFAAVAAALMLRGAEPAAQGENRGTSGWNNAGDLVIPAAEVTETALFYPVSTEGVELEILAVRATDGTVRTAFNTCQICYNSGRGYYQQQGEYLVCQNCGNRFRADDVGVMRGGCNPIPLAAGSEDGGEEIVIPSSLLEEASALFANWRR